MATLAKEVVSAEEPVLNKTWLAFAFGIYFVFYIWVRWYEGVYGWAAGLDSLLLSSKLTG